MTVCETERCIQAIRPCFGFAVNVAMRTLRRRLGKCALYVKPNKATSSFICLLRACVNNCNFNGVAFHLKRRFVMKNNQNKQNNTKTCGNKNCGNKNCNSKNNHGYNHGGNND